MGGAFILEKFVAKCFKVVVKQVKMLFFSMNGGNKAIVRGFHISVFAQFEK